MSPVTTRLVTLEPPGDSLDSLINDMNALKFTGAACITVGQAHILPKFRRQPDGYAVVDFITAPGLQGEHDKFILAAGKALSTYNTPYAWQTSGGKWHVNRS